ncbi:MAG: hypothetical protein F9K43_07650 [Bauldia sp.]|nr:MAG: hypothetical protein F9K43_07650 [Bauldia sp.]
MVLTRVPGWDRALPLVIERHMALPGEWGVSDCWTLTMDAIEAVTGERVLKHLRRYRTEAGGYRLFAKHGFATVEEALASVLKPVGRLSAQRGDVGVIDRDGLISAGVIDAEGLVVKTLYGEGKTVTGSDVRHFPVTAVKASFKVGRE